MTREEYITTLLQSFSLVSVLSEKNDCKVLRLRSKALGQDIVLRSLPRHLEAYEFLCSVRCAHLPEIYDAFDMEDGQIVLEEYISGITIAQAMGVTPYRWISARKVMKDVCCALSVLHSQGIIHRDVKPENVMLREDGRAVLVDLNASRIQSAASKDTVIMGTVGYASPEQLGLAQSDARTDIYAAGVLLNVMLTGRHPTEVFARGRAGKIIRKCTALNPDNRYQSAEKLALAL